MCDPHKFQSDISTEPQQEGAATELGYGLGLKIRPTLFKYGFSATSFSCGVITHPRQKHKRDLLKNVPNRK